ncbi:hypothetical protein TNCV_4021321 [Trichonephila clavipes]|nr:hypothetical protein TNCV_4021321 [Trichonephila clavipes]
MGRAIMISHHSSSPLVRLQEEKWEAHVYLQDVLPKNYGGTHMVLKVDFCAIGPGDRAIDRIIDIWRPLTHALGKKDVAKHGGTPNSRRAKSPLLRFMEGEERWVALTTSRVFSLKKMAENRAKSYCHLYGTQC